MADYFGVLNIKDIGGSKNKDNIGYKINFLNKPH